MKTNLKVLFSFMFAGVVSLVLTSVCGPRYENDVDNLDVSQTTAEYDASDASCNIETDSQDSGVLMCVDDPACYE